MAFRAAVDVQNPAWVLLVLVLSCGPVSADHLVWYHPPSADDLPNGWEWHVPLDLQPVDLNGDKLLAVGSAGFNQTTLALLSARDGHRFWSRTLDGAWHYAVAWTDGHILAGLRDDEAYQQANLHRDGRTIPGAIVDLDEATGKTLGVHALRQMPEDLQAGDGLVFVFSSNPFADFVDNSALEAYALSDWRLVWKMDGAPRDTSTSLLAPQPPPFPYGSWGPHLRLLDGSAAGILSYVSSEWVVGVNAFDGRLAWKTPCPNGTAASSIQYVGYTDGVLYAGCEGVFAVDGATGQAVWGKQLGGRPFQNPTVQDGYVVYKGLEGLWRVPADGSAQGELQDMGKLGVSDFWAALPSHLAGTVLISTGHKVQDDRGHLVAWDFLQARPRWAFATTGDLLFAQPFDDGSLLWTAMPAQFLRHPQLVFLRDPQHASPPPAADFAVHLEPTAQGARLSATGFVLNGSQPVQSWYWMETSLGAFRGPEASGQSMATTVGPGTHKLTLLAADADGRSTMLVKTFDVVPLETPSGGGETIGAGMAPVLLLLLLAFAWSRGRQEGG
jgi:outer membrane protein assembly factor BamB